MKAPVVQKHMTRIPQEIDRIERVSHAIDLMKTHRIRHLPVMKGLRLEAIISERDILKARLSKGRDVGDLPIEEIYQRPVLTVGPLMPVDEVARLMLNRRVGSAVVVDGGYVVGVFTSTDALKTLATLFGAS